MVRIFLTLGLVFNLSFSKAQNTISGNISYQASNVEGARITLFNADTSLFFEERSFLDGRYQFSNIPNDNYKIGVAKPDFDYIELSVVVNTEVKEIHFSLLPETEKGRWDVIVKSPEPLGGTDLGVLMPNGKIYYCHDTKDPFYFDPIANDTLSVMGSDSIQGCVGPVLLADSTVWFFGGTLKEVYGPGTKKVKLFNSKTGKWKTQNYLKDYRWYPTVSPISDGKILVIGGGGLDNPKRVKTSEIYDPKTGLSKLTDNIEIGNEVSPIVPLLNGKTLMTHRPPQLFDPSTNQWELAADFVQSNRMSNGDHSDHELVLMPDGNIFAFGYKSFTSNLGTYVERYDVNANKWELKSSINPIRSRAKAIILPDQKILVTNGEKEDKTDETPVNQWGYMKKVEQYNAAKDTWRNLADMKNFREYHAILTLVPDGRVIAVGGEGQPGNEPPQSIIEAFTPPYLFRGVRPEIININSNRFAPGGVVSFDIAKTNTITSVLLMANAVNTHFMNSSSNRIIELDFTHTNGKVTANLPTDSLLLFEGFYMLFAMVDDIPSKAKIISVQRNINLVSPVDEKTLSNLLVYPNPCKDIININSEIPIIEVEVYDTNGHKIKAFKNSNIKNINLRDFIPQAYFVKIFTSDGNKYIHKIMKID